MINKIKSNQILQYLIILIIGLIIVLIVRVTYAYFAFDPIGAQTTVNVDSSSVDKLEFDNGEPLSLIVTPTTLAESGNNVESISYPKATLLANNNTNTSTQSYYGYLKISDNTFTYTTEEKTPEILLTVLDPEGNEIIDISGFNYLTVGGVSGFDVTEFNGNIPFASGYTINSNSSTEYSEDKWTLTLTYVNLGSDQSANLGKALNSEIIMQKEPLG